MVCQPCTYGGYSFIVFSIDFIPDAPGALTQQAAVALANRQGHQALLARPVVSRLFFCIRLLRKSPNVSVPIFPMTPVSIPSLPGAMAVLQAQPPLCRDILSTNMAYFASASALSVIFTLPANIP